MMGQNLYFYSIPYNVSHGVLQWFLEIENYDFENNVCIDNNQPCNHYTQLVWSTSTHVGCAMAHCPSLVDPDNSGTYDGYYLVCNYGPGGNVAGVKPFEVGTPCTRCEGGDFTCYDDLCRDCAEDGSADQCTCVDACEHGTPDSSCMCSTCDVGWTGVNCADVCQDHSPQCGVTRGWKKRHCDNPHIQWNCPLMCELCRFDDSPTTGPVNHVVALNEVFLAEITDDSTTYGTINWESGPYIPPNTDLTSQPCHIQGVLHFMPPAYARSVDLKFQTNSPTGWQFDIGDSSCHDGFGGTCNPNENDVAEIQLHDNTIMAYRGEKGKNYLTVDDVGVDNSWTTVIVKLSRYFVHVEVDGDVKYDQCRRGTLKANDFYIGVNRIINDFQGNATFPDRVGTGLCSIDVTWQNEPYEHC